MNKNRKLGAFYGLAIGDALGAQVEFKTRGTFDLVTGYRDGGPHHLSAGQWTDDTSMALALLDSIRSVGWNLTDQGNKYVSWWQNGTYSVNGRCFDIGNTTMESLANFRSGKAPHLSGKNGEWDQGNGSIMRLAPVAMYFGDLLISDPMGLAQKLIESSLITHRHKNCLAACAYFGFILSGFMHGYPMETVLNVDWDMYKFLDDNGYLTADVAAVAKGSFKTLTEQTVKSTGYVIDTLEAALWAFWQTKSFEECVLHAVNLGGDSDTVGAVAGQIAGAYWGYDGIPVDLLDGLQKHPAFPNSAGLPDV